MENINILIKELINIETAVSSDDGDVVFNDIVTAFNKDFNVILDFAGITLMTTAFLNSAIGQLYSIYTSDELNSKLKLKNIADEDRILFKKVIERAKQYQENKKGFEDSANNAIYGN
jgi:hypothetical protein